jgi:hypothetical protein
MHGYDWVLTEVQDHSEACECWLFFCADEVKESNQQLQKSVTELDDLQKKYLDAQQTAKEKGDLVSDLQGTNDCFIFVYNFYFGEVFPLDFRAVPWQPSCHL